MPLWRRLLVAAARLGAAAKGGSAALPVLRGRLGAASASCLPAPERSWEEKWGTYQRWLVIAV